MNKNKVELVIKEQKTIFALGLGYIGELLENTGFEIDSLVDKINSNPFKYAPIMMFESLNYSKVRYGQPNPFTSVGELMDWLDENGSIQNEQLMKFLEAFTKSLTKDVPKSNAKPKTTKKK